MGPTKNFSESEESKYGFPAGDNSLPGVDFGILKGNLELPMSNEKCTVWVRAKGNKGPLLDNLEIAKCDPGFEEEGFCTFNGITGLLK